MENTLIFGDSYSTFKEYVPKGYAVYYSETERPETDVTKVEQTWWYQVVEEATLKLALNNSWSGSTIGYTGYNNTDCSKSSSFIYRLKELIDNGFFVKNQIDKVFVFGGTNDSWSNAPLGEAKYSNWEEKELFSVLPAICYFLNLLKETLPQADIYCLINTDIKPEIASCMKNACEKYQITPITFNSIDKKCGHPTIQGMKNIKDSVLKVINK
ncbi:MAG: hypothetical protein IIW02_00280 [Clostridia bacterium]|nr:hypothetical protein [Clostridia bacterium]